MSLFLHVSSYDGAILAVITECPWLEEGHHFVLDAEVVESRTQAIDWFNKSKRTKPWEKWNERGKDTSDNNDHGRSS